MLTRIALSALVLAIVSPSLVNAQTTARERGGPENTRLDKRAVSVPMLSWGPRPIAMAKINGKGPYRFILDTGCSYAAVIDEGLLKELKLLSSDAMPAGRDIGETEPVSLETIAIGDATFTDVGALPSDIRGFMPPDKEAPIGILGLPLFNDCLLTFDYPNRKFVFESGRLPSKGEDILRCSIDDRHGTVLAIRPKVAGQAMNVHIDTGSPGVLTLLNKWQKKLPLKGKPIEAGKASTPSGTTAICTATLDGTLEVGNHLFKDPKVDFADLGPMVDADCGNIGSGLLKDFAMTVDQKNRRLRLTRGSAVNERVEHIVRRKSDAPYRIGVAFQPDANGLLVMEVLAGGAGAESGLKTGDVVVNINGKAVGEVRPAEMKKAFGSPAPVELTVRRDGRTLKLTLTPKRADG